MRLTASRAAAPAGVDVWVPTTATPTEPLLKPVAWPPITADWIPPPRPSQISPKRSTKKLYPTSDQPRTSMWYACTDRSTPGTWLEA